MLKFNTLLFFLTWLTLHIYSPVFAQETFDWYEGRCLYTGHIDTSKAKYGEVVNAYYTLINPNEMNQPYLGYQPKDTVYLKVANIERESQSYIDEINAMDFPKSSYWQALRNQKLEELKAVSELRKTCILALYNPKILKKSPYYKSCKEVCGALIEGGEKLMNAWKKLQGEQYAEAYEPELVKEAFQLMWDSPNREMYARMELLRYVFYKQASAQIHYVDINTAVMNQFMALMSEVTSDCH